MIFLAAMQAIPRDVIEAAVVDGANRWRTFLNVTVPMLRPTIIFVVITSTIGGLQIFDETRMYDNFGLGGPDPEWMTRHDVPATNSAGRSNATSAGPPPSPGGCS